MTLKSNYTEFDQKIYVKNVSVIEQMFGVRTHRADENKTRANDWRSKPNTAERLAESTRAALFSNIILERISNLLSFLFLV